jgi:hypothetical protein
MEDMVVQVTLGRDEAIVLFDLLCDFAVEDGTLQLADSIDRLSLVRLHGALEKTLVEPLDPQYDASLSAARARLSRYLSG